MPDVPHTIREKLRAWYRRAKRQMPWRGATDPYAVWVSEIMLQQTRVETVIPYYERWMARFPTVAALAEAPLDDVLARWAGLGYYSRARNLKAAAELVLREHGGQFPSDEASVLALPGIGRYTAGAIRSIAFGAQAALVDGNVERVLARLYLIDDEVKSRAGQEKLWTIAEQLVPARGAGDHNQALMELGATVCTPKQPACATCPLRGECGALAAGRVGELPRRAKAKAIPTVDWVTLRLVDGERLLLVRRPPRGLWGGLWEFPSGEVESHEPAATAATRIVRERTGLAARGIERIQAFEHVLSHRRLRIHVFAARATGAPRLQFYDDGRWLTPTQAQKMGVAAWMQPLLSSHPEKKRTTRKRA